MALLAWRRVGPYGAFGPPRFDGLESDWSPLLAEASRQSIRYRELGLAISYDNPFTTPPHLQQLDACVPLLDETIAPAGNTIRRLMFEGGRFAAVEHRGPTETLIQAYVSLVDAVRSSGRHRVRDAPPVEILRELSPDPMRRVTEIYMPIERM